ncbi:MAG: hypothetical protein LWX07_09860 [Bacteroidetes bacterium]|nr:hypothetical protein [Bacteroidota bacterium]
MSLHSGLYCQTVSQSPIIDYSIYLVPGGGVHSSVSSVTDKNGNTFAAGGTRGGLKVTNDAYQKNYSGHNDETGGDIFLMKLSPSGGLIYSTYLGCSGSEHYCLQIALDDNENVYVGFTTNSTGLPVSGNAYQKSNKGDNDHYIIKFSNDCKYIASTYLGGIGDDHWTRLAVYKNTLFLVGKTTSPDFPVSDNAFQRSYDNSSPPDTSQPWLSGDITITSLSLNLDKIFRSTYLGGGSLDYVNSFTFGNDGKIYLAGGTYSCNFPVTENAYKKTLSGTIDGFLTVMNQKLSKISYSTYIGGDSTDQVNSAVLLNPGNIILAGETKSPDFPVTSDALSNKYFGGRSDGFIMKFNLKSNKPVYSTFIGGTKNDYVNYAAITGSGNFVLVGSSSSKDFPVTNDAIHQTIDGGMDLVIMILDKTLKRIEYSTYGGGSKQLIMMPNADYTKCGSLLISFINYYKEFPVTMKYTEPDSTGTNCLMKLNLEDK